MPNRTDTLDLDYPTGVILDVELYTALQALAAAHSAPQEEPVEPAATVLEPQVAQSAVVELEPAPVRRAGRRRKAQGDT